MFDFQILVLQHALYIFSSNYNVHAYDIKSNYSQVNAQPSGFDGSLCLLYQLASLAKGAFDHMFTIILIFILNIIKLMRQKSA